MKDELTMKEVLMILAENPETIFEGEANDGGRIIGPIMQVDVRVLRPQYRMDNYMWMESVRLYKEPKPEFPVKIGDKVLVRDYVGRCWKLDMFARFRDERFCFLSSYNNAYRQLIQITDENRDDLQKIVGTSDDPPTGIKIWTKEDFE